MRLLKIILKIIMGFIVLFILAYVVLATMVRGYSQTTGMVSDGFGRELVLTLAIFRVVFWEDSMWAGFRWFVLDSVIIWGLIIINYNLFKISGKIKAKERKQ